MAYQSHIKCQEPGYSAAIPPGGGALTVDWDTTAYTFPPGAFGPASADGGALGAAGSVSATGSVTVTHAMLQPWEAPATGDLAGARHFYNISAVDSLGRAVQPSLAYTVVITYTLLDLYQVDESSLALYAWDGGRWARE